MQTIILCGGKGTRLAEETIVRPKPMVTIGAKPILWHIMKGYESHGLKDFTLAVGYLGEYIKNYFLHYSTLNSDFEVSLSSGKVTTLQKNSVPDWNVKIVDTGEDTLTGGRVLRLKNHINGTFCLTYGDGVCDVDVNQLIKFHKSHGKLVTITAVQPTGRFGNLDIHEGGEINSFREKIASDEGWINGGFMVMEPGVLDFISGDDMPLEADPMAKLANAGQLMAFKHKGFWQCMDTIRDRHYLEQLWEKGAAPWKTWQS